MRLCMLSCASGGILKHRKIVLGTCRSPKMPPPSRLDHKFVDSADHRVYPLWCPFRNLRVGLEARLVSVILRGCRSRSSDISSDDGAMKRVCSTEMRIAISTRLSEILVIILDNAGSKMSAHVLAAAQTLACGSLSAVGRPTTAVFLGEFPERKIGCAGGSLRNPSTRDKSARLQA